LAQAGVSSVADARRHRSTVESSDGMYAMQMFGRFVTCAFLLALAVPTTALEVVKGAHHHHGKHHKGKHHHHHKGHHHHHGKHHNKDAPSTAKVEELAKMIKADTKALAKPAAVKATVPAQPIAMHVAAVNLSADEKLVEKMKALEVKLSAEKKKRAQVPPMENGHLLVSGPVPADFAQRFAQAVAAATGADSKKVSVTKTSPVKDQPGVVAIDFKAEPKVVVAVETQAGDSDSKLASGNMHSFLVGKDDEDDAKDEEAAAKPKKREEAEPKGEIEATPVEQKGIDIDTAMPYGDLEPFGREDTAQELTEDSVKESDSMVDQLERAEVAEEKRAVFRSLTRLRGAAITSFDGVARSQTGNIDEYNKIHQWRKTHPLHHLADEESDVSKWAFPDNADF